MTQIRKPSSLFIVGLLLGLLIAAGISQLTSAVTVQPGQTAQPALQTEMSQITLPSAQFLRTVYGPASDYPVDQLKGMADALESVCIQVSKGFTYMSIRDGLAEVQGWTKGEAGLFLSAAIRTECR